MSSASSNQSFVRNEAGYEELYPSGYRDPDELSKRSPSATSPSSKNEDIESVVSTDGLREFVMLPKWMANNFTSMSRRHILKHLEQSTKYPTTSLSIYPTS